MFNFLKPKLTVVTHNGRFHPDDVFAVATLQLVFQKSHNIKIIRTRESEIIQKADIVVDVGGEYDESENKFDHHQIGGAGVRDNGIPYASFGLVWKKFGPVLCGNDEVFASIEKLLVQPTDAGDSGVEIVAKKYGDIYPYGIYNVMDTFLPSWKEKFSFDVAFTNVVSFAKRIIQREIILQNDKLSAGVLIDKAYEESTDKRLIILSGYYPFSDYVKNFPELLFIVFFDVDQWALKTIKVDTNSFTDRKKLPESWAGKSGEEFEKVTGVAGAVFCHINRFIAKAKTKEAILKLAEIALEN